MSAICPVPFRSLWNPGVYSTTNDPKIEYNQSVSLLASSDHSQSMHVLEVTARATSGCFTPDAFINIECVYAASQCVYDAYGIFLAYLSDDVSECPANPKRTPAP